MRVDLQPDRIEDYRLFLKIKSLPRYEISRRSAWFPDEYASMVGIDVPTSEPVTYLPSEFLLDYQAGIAEMALRKRKFAVFLDCGLGKTLILLEYARHVAATLTPGQCVLIVSPLMVVKQTVSECRRFYGDSLRLEQVVARDLQTYLLDGSAGRIGITNYDAISDDLRPGRVGALVLDESSMLKSHYGKWAKKLIDMGKGLRWKLCLTGTPAPNDQIEYANHAVFLDEFPTVNAFLAKFFVNRGETQNRWELKPHAMRPFYRALSHWSFFMANPGRYGWKDNAGQLPPINVHIHDVPLTDEQSVAVIKAGGDMFGTPGGITSRSKLARLAKGCGANGGRVETRKTAFIRDLIATWPTESTLVWCRYNAEQEIIAESLPAAASIDGATPIGERERIIADFQQGKIRTLISKPKILGFGLNLQRATRHVFSSLQDSYEEYYQAVKRSNRIGSTCPLNVHIPVTDIERPMVDTVLRKASMVQRDTEEQERLFLEMRTRTKGV